MALRLKRIKSGSYSHSTAESTTAKTLVDRQLGYERQTKSLVFDDAGTLKRFPSEAGYELVIRTQAQFDAWAANTSVASTVLICPGTYEYSGAGIRLCASIKKISGYGATICVRSITLLQYTTFLGNTYAYTFSLFYSEDSIAVSSVTRYFASRNSTVAISGLTVLFPKGLQFNDSSNLYTVAAFSGCSRLVDIKVTTECYFAYAVTALFYCCSILERCTAYISCSTVLNKNFITSFNVHANQLYGYFDCEQLLGCSAFINEIPSSVYNLFTDASTGINFIEFGSCTALVACAALASDIDDQLINWGSVQGYGSCSAMVSCFATGAKAEPSAITEFQPYAFAGVNRVAACLGKAATGARKFIDSDSTGW